jgi:hypothetical protein
MKEILKKLKDIYADPCVTILLNTHRTAPDNKRDPINLKNLTTEAENRLLAEYDKRYILPLIDKMKALVDSIDHTHNLESLILFVNNDLAEYVRLPVEVTPRTVVDNTFATRDLLRAMHQAANYHVLVLSQQQARLIEAHNDRVVREIEDKVFPMKNGTLYSTDKLQKTMAQGSDNLIKEWFNRVDKALQTYHQANPMPVLLTCEERNYFHYREIADKKDIIIGHLNMNRDAEKAHHIVPEAWKIVQEFLREQREKSISELEIAVSQQRFLSDTIDIWRAVREGRGEALFVEEGFYQPAAVTADGEVELLPADAAAVPGVVDDLIDEIIEALLQTGGRAVFLPKGSLEKFQGLALKTRW